MTGSTATSFPASTCSSKSRTRRGRAATLSASVASAISRPLASRRRNTGAHGGIVDARAMHPRALGVHHDHRMAIDRLDRGKRRALLDRDRRPRRAPPRRPRARAGWPDRHCASNIVEHRGAARWAATTAARP